MIEHQTSPEDAAENWKKELLALEQEYSTMAIEDDQTVEEKLVERKVETAKQSSAPWNHPGRFAPSSSKTKVIKTITPPRKLIISRQHAKFLTNVARVLHQHKKQEQNAEQALSIRLVSQKQFAIKQDSTEAYIKRVLLDQQDGLTIVQIIDHIEALGWISESKYHRYNLVAKTLRQCYYMFDRFEADGKMSKYKLRTAFLPQHPIERTVSAAIVADATIPTTKDLVVGVIQYKGLNKHGTYPSQVWTLLQHMGYDLTYKAVRLAMQDEKVFKRNGFWYALQT